MTMVSNLILEEAAASQSARLLKIANAWRAYYGQMKKPLRTKPGEIDDNVLLNYSSIAVNKGVSFLFGNDVDMECKENLSKENEWLDGCLAANKWMTFLTKLALNGGVCGSTFLKVIPGDPYPRMVVLDPSNMTVLWSPDDYEDITCYIIQWNAIDPQTMKPLTRRELVERQDNGNWIIIDQERVGDAKIWVEIGRSVWNYQWAPIFHCQNLPAPNEFWGVADLESDVLEVNAAMNFTVSNIARIQRYHAHPQTWVRGSGMDRFNTGPDTVISLEGDNAMLANLEMKGDMGGSMEYFDRLKQSWHEITHIPVVATGELGVNTNLSGVALEILYRPLLERTNVKRLLYGDMLRDMCSRLLELGGFQANIPVEIHWQNMLPTNVLEEAQTGLIYEQLGVSRDTILTRLGFDPELEEEKTATEKTEEGNVGSTMLSNFDKGV
jgi:hypothetical protein